MQDKILQDSAGKLWLQKLNNNQLRKTCMKSDQLCLGTFQERTSKEAVLDQGIDGR
jgi:hypothetical protein